MLRSLLGDVEFGVQGVQSYHRRLDVINGQAVEFGLILNVKAPSQRQRPSVELLLQEFNPLEQL